MLVSSLSSSQPSSSVSPADSPPRGTPRPVETWQNTFRRPPGEYRPAPFLVLNDEYPPGEGEAQLTLLLESLAAAGYGGVYLHPRPGLITEYLSPRWFEVIRHCVRECRRIGLIPHLYDENSYPSGSAGGHVSSRVPDARSRHVLAVRGQGRQGLPGSFLTLNAWTGSGPGAPLERSSVESGTEWIAFVMQDFSPLPSQGETIFPSLLDPRTTPAFLETTYEAYRRELGALWSEVPSMFTDEPHLPGATFGAWSAGLHLTPYVLGEYQRQFGEELNAKVGELFFDVGSFSETRHRFYDLCHRLWVAHWALPLEQWCRENAIKLTGHYLENDWPCPYATPGHVHLLAHMDWPGTDMLLGFLLKGHDFYDVQGFDPAPPGQEPHGLFYLRQVHSLANQLGKERVMCESWGAAGGESAPEDWLRIGRWLVVHGVNLLVPHSSWDTIRGSRKTDHPPNFAPQSPWFDYLAPMHDELARLCWIANQGECHHRTLVIDSLTTAFCRARKADTHEPKAQPDPDRDFFGACTGESLRSIHPVKRAADHFAQDLADHQVDFDLGDEYVLEEFGQVSDAHLAIGRRAYALVVLIPGLENLRTATVSRLDAYLRQGGILQLPPVCGHLTVDGADSGIVERWKHEFPRQILSPADAAEARRMICQIHPPRLSFSEPTSGVAHLHRLTPHGDVIVAVNSTPSPLCQAATLLTQFPHLYALDPKTGEGRLIPTRRTANRLEFDLELPSSQAAVFLATDETLSFPSVTAGSSPSSVSPAELIRVERRSENVLVVDCCELDMNGRIFPSETVTAANQRYWQAHGFTTNGWNMVVQHRDHLVGRDAHMTANSGAKVHYHFLCETAPADCHLAVECPECWTVSLNGQVLDFHNSEAFRDPRIRKISVAGRVQAGRNTVTLEGRPFSVRQEIDQIYLLGDFSISADSAGFIIRPPRPITWGSWKDQGLPFFDGEMSYFVKPPAPGSRLRLRRDDFGGALVAILQEGREIARIWEAPWEADLANLSAEPLELRVVGLPKNLFGPFHDPDHRWGLATPNMWIGSYVRTSPTAGEHYGLLDLGLLAPPHFLIPS